MTRLVTLENKRFEHLLDVLSQLVGNVLGSQVGLIDLIWDELVLYLGGIKQPCRIGFCDFFHHFATLFGKDSYICRKIDASTPTN